MKKLIGVVVLALGSSGCVATKGDLQDLRGAWSERDEAVQEALDELEEGKITFEQFQARLAEANGEVYSTLDAKIEEVAERAQDVVAATAPVTGNPLIDLGLAVVTSILGAGYGVNRYRDGRRKARGEPA